MISIIIVNYKSQENTIRYVRKELKKISIPHIIVIVNNAATEVSNSQFEQGLNASIIFDINYISDKLNNIYVISVTENLGFAKANNLGVKFSVKYFDVNYILFTNNDIHFIDEDVVECLVKKINKLDSCAIIGPKVLGTDGHVQSPEPYYPFWSRYVLRFWIMPLLSTKMKIKIFNTEYTEKATEGNHYKIMGSFFLVNSIDFINCGMMDSNTFLYAEEIILSERMKSIGKNVYYYPEVAVIHEHGQTISKFYNDMQIMMQKFESESYYYKKYKSISPISILVGKFSIITYYFFKRIFK